MNLNKTVIEDWIAPEALADSETLKYICVFCVFLLMVSITFNSTLIWILISNKELLQRVNIMVLALTILSLYGTLIELPMLITSIFNKKYIKYIQIVDFSLALFL